MFAYPSAHAGASATSFHETVLSCDNNVPIYFEYGITGASVANPTQYNFAQNAIMDIDGTLTQFAPNLTNITSTSLFTNITTIGPYTPTTTQSPANVKFYGWNEAAFLNMNSKIGYFHVICNTGLLGAKINLSPFSNLAGFLVQPSGGVGTLNITSITGYENRPIKEIMLKNLNISSDSSRLPPDAKLADVTQLLRYTINNTNMTGQVANNKTYTNLITYDISGNNFASPPGWTITAAPALTTFSIANNTGITSLPTFTSVPTALTTINAHNDTVGAGNIASIPAITGLTNLQTITLGNNKLAGIVPTITGLTGLQTFSAPGNLYTGLPTGYWSGCKSLQTLDLNSNNLQKYVNSTEFWFSGCDKITSINFSGNKLSGYLPRLDFATGDTLNTVDFSNNSFDLVPSDYFTGYNRVGGVVATTMGSGLRDLKVFNISNNKINNQALPWPAWRGNLSVNSFGFNGLTNIYAANNQLNGNDVLGLSYWGFAATYPIFGLKYIDISNNQFTPFTRSSIVGIMANPGASWQIKNVTIRMRQQYTGGVFSTMAFAVNVSGWATNAGWTMDFD
jgi:Leucine-rich repeat (LRR) protein